MLSQLRKGVSSWIAKIFIGILILSFAVWGVSGIALTSTNNNVAEVGDVEITRQDFEKLYPTVINEWTQRLKTRLTREQIRAFQIPTQVLTRLVNQAVVENHANNLTLSVSDEQIGKVISEDPQLKDATGQFNKDILKQVLLSERISEQQFFNEQREASIRRQITSIFSQKKIIPEVLINSIYHHREDKLKAEYFIIPETVIPKPKEPTEEALKAYYETSKSAYEAPEFRKVALYALSVNELKKSFTPQEEDIKKTYEARKKSLISPETRVFDQILFETKEKAEEAHKALEQGTSFEKVAKDFGQDGKATSIGPVTRQAMADKSLAGAVFGLEKDKYTGPVEGTFAIVIAKVKTIKKREEKTLEDVRKDIVDLLKTREVQKKVKVLYDQVEDLRAGGATIADVAKEMGGKAVVIEKMNANSAGPDGKPVKDLPPTTKLSSAIFEAAIGDDTVPVRHQDGGYVWFDVLDIMPKRIKTYDEVKADVKTAFIKKEQKQLAATFASDTEKRIKGGEDFAKVAASLKAKIEKPDAFGRGAVAKDIPAYISNKLFSIKPGEVLSDLGPKNEKWLVIKVLSHEPAKTEGKPYEVYKKKVLDELQVEMTDDLVAEYLKRAKSYYKVETNQTLFEQLVNGL